MGFKKPFCDEVPTSLLSLDHLEGVKMRDYLHVASESGLKEAFQGWVFKTPLTKSVFYDSDQSRTCR